MRTHLIPHGDQFAVVIPDSILQELGIDESTLLEVSIESDSVRVTPLPKELHREQFEKALEKTARRYGNALRRLADS